MEERTPSAEEIEGWIAEFAELRERGERVTREDFAARHPAGGAQLLMALRALERTEALFPTGAITDLPREVGPYRVLGEIGRGGMGRILRVVHENHPDEVLALKLLHDSLQHHPRALERFRREGETLERVNHPGVVRFFETGVADGRPFLVMELVEGTSLAALFSEARDARRESADPGRSATSFVALDGEGGPYVRAARVVARAARALAAVHREGVLHRDLNPKNVILRPNGDPILVDFGLMRSQGTPTLTESGDMLGTPQYMAPEQARGERVDARVDVFGLGVILFELLTLSPPRRSEETLALLREASNLPLPTPRRLDERVPADLAAIVRRATGHRPEWRYGGAEDLASDLEDFVDGRAVSVTKPGLVQRAIELWLIKKPLVLASAAVLLAMIGFLIFRLGGTLADPVDLEAAVDETRIRAVVAWSDGDLEKTSAVAEELAALAPDHPMVEFFRELGRDRLLESSADPAVQALIDGEKERRAGRHEEAIKYYEVSWNISPGSPLVLFLNGRSYLAAGDLEAARGILEPVSHYLPDCVLLHRSLGELYGRLGLTADTVKALETAVRLAPENADVWLELSQAYLAHGDPEGALERARSALRFGGEAHTRALSEMADQVAAEGGQELARQLRELLGQ